MKKEINAVITEELKGLAKSLFKAEYEAKYNLGTYRKVTIRRNKTRESWAKLNPEIKNGHPQDFPNWLFSYRMELRKTGVKNV